MQSLFDKFRVTSMAAAHALMNKAMGPLTPEIIDQYIRDLSKQIGLVHDEVILKQDDVNQAERAIALAQARVKKLKSDIKLLAPQNGAMPAPDVSARLNALAKEAMSLESSIPDKQVELEQFKSVMASMNQIVGQMEAKMHEMEGKRSTIASQSRMAATQNRAAKAIEAGAAATEVGSGIDSLADQARRDAMVANDRFQRAAAKIGGGNDPVADAEASAYIKSLTQGDTATAQ